MTIRDDQTGMAYAPRKSDSPMRFLFLLALTVPATAFGSSGSVSLVDGFGLQYYVNDAITYSTTSSASGAASEASFTTSVSASTVSGGVTVMSIDDAFDGYNAIAVNGVRYFNNGSSSLECADRQAVFGVQTIGNLEVSRKVYVPEADGFIRWMNIVTNVGTSAESVVVRSDSNLGSDSNTLVVTSSSGDDVVDLTDDWAVSMEAFSGSTSGDPRLAHVWQNALGSVLADTASLNVGDDNPVWQYTFTLDAGDTAVFLHYAAGTGSWIEAQDMAEYVSDLPASAVACMNDAEWSAVVNFGVDCSSLSDSCNEGAFEVTTGACVANPVNDGGSCDDGSACTVLDVCGEGSCAGVAAPENVGDGIDANCDGAVQCYADADSDGVRTETVIVSADADCTDSGEALLSASSGDCDDSNAAVFPGAVEVCDDANVDENCDTLADDASATGQAAFYADADSDTFGDAAVSMMACDAPEAYVSDATDCDDTNAAAYPGAAEVPDDGVDQDCDGEDTVTPEDSGDSDTEDTDPADTDEDTGEDKGGCGCSVASAPASSALFVALAGAALLRRRRS